MSTTLPLPDVNELRRRFDAHGQAHVFRFWEGLDAAQRSALLRQAERLGDDLPNLVAGQKAAFEALRADGTPGCVAPGSAIALPENGGDTGRMEAARKRGLELLEAGRLGVFVVAGGQGTRLGFAGPKGAFPVGPVSDRSLFALQAQKIAGLSRRSGRPIPWYVMTSEATDAATRDFFETQAHFGLDPEDVFVFTQGMVPAWDFEGRLILEAPHRIAESPNGHGGALTALADSGALDHMEARGIDRLFYYQVDNALVRIGDPVYLGFHEASGAEMSCKVIRKCDPAEKVGVVAEMEGRPAVIEYTELAEKLRDERDSDGELVYWAGNIAIHLFNVDFLRRVARESERLLPFHASPKLIESVSDRAKVGASGEPNGYKLERFVFDALPWARQTCVLEVRAADEFSPIKNADGKDSPESCRAELVACYRTWLEAAGIEVPMGAEAIEIDHSLIDSADEALGSGFSSVAAAGNAILVSTGMDA